MPEHDPCDAGGDHRGRQRRAAPGAATPSPAAPRARTGPRPAARCRPRRTRLLRRRPPAGAAARSAAAPLRQPARAGGADELRRAPPGPATTPSPTVTIETTARGDALDHGHVGAAQPQRLRHLGRLPTPAGAPARACPRHDHAAATTSATNRRQPTRQLPRRRGTGLGGSRRRGARPDAAGRPVPRHRSPVMTPSDNDDRPEAGAVAGDDPPAGDVGLVGEPVTARDRAAPGSSGGDVLPAPGCGI